MKSFGTAVRWWCTNWQNLLQINMLSKFEAKNPSIHFDSSSSIDVFWLLAHMFFCQVFQGKGNGFFFIKLMIKMGYWLLKQVLSQKKGSDIWLQEENLICSLNSNFLFHNNFHRTVAEQWWDWTKVIWFDSCF